MLNFPLIYLVQTIQRPLSKQVKYLPVFFALLCFTFPLGAHTLNAQPSTLEFELEGGPVWQTRNSVEIPNDGSATRFSLVDVIGRGPWFGGRVYVTWNISERHGIRLLFAPLSITETGTLNDPVIFAGASFGESAPVEATYQFNSYRVSYRWRALERDRVRLWLGFTAKIRDADIVLRQGATMSHKDDLGFVPLLHVAGDWTFGRVGILSLDVDGLAGGPGRAIDAALKMGVRMSDRTTFRVGYRTVEGGADVEEVYTFAWLHYLAFSIDWGF
jgi:hypothetical protein